MCIASQTLPEGRPSPGRSPSPAPPMRPQTHNLRLSSCSSAHLDIGSGSVTRMHRPFRPTQLEAERSDTMHACQHVCTTCRTRYRNVRAEERNAGKWHPYVTICICNCVPLEDAESVETGICLPVFGDFEAWKITILGTINHWPSYQRHQRQLIRAASGFSCRSGEVTRFNQLSNRLHCRVH